jgi:hypothetical protein
LLLGNKIFESSAKWLNSFWKKSAEGNPDFMGTRVARYRLGKAHRITTDTSCSADRALRTLQVDDDPQFVAAFVRAIASRSRPTYERP